jgi:hypothetical protein
MRVVVGSERLRDTIQGELRRHLQMLSRFVERAEAGHFLTMVLRSPGADPAKALIGMKGALQRKGANAKVILAKLDPEADLRQLYASLSELDPEAHAHRLIRWASNPRLLEAHEQVTYGDSLCWSGDAMRREADRRNALDLFYEDSPDTVRMGRLAFKALWEASSPVPMRRLLGATTQRPSGAFEQAPDPTLAASTVRESLQGWPLIRH